MTVTFKITLLLLTLSTSGLSASIFDFRPDKFARERYMKSRIQMRARSLGIDSTIFGNFISLDFVAMVNKNGYPAEEHLITTTDGYKLRLHRIPGSRSKPKTPGKPIVFLQHGVFASSDTWILMGPGNDLAYMLADAGYDVWLGNARGNTYSRSHVKMSPNYDSEFWQFSFHENAMYDIPASIDYILKKTNQQSLVYVGHSMGTSISYILLSAKPEYNEKISLVISLAPVAFWYAPPGPFVSFLKRNVDAIKNFVINARIREIFPLTAGSTQLLAIICGDRSIFQNLCADFIYFTSGYNPQQLNTSSLPYLFSFFPAGGSTKTLIHYSQNLLTGDFKMFDYGPKENIFKYKQREAPAYNLSNVITPVALFYGQGDAVVSPGNPLELAKRLPNCITVESIPDVKFSHLDFLFSRDVKSLLNNRLMELTGFMIKRNLDLFFVGFLECLKLYEG